MTIEQAKKRALTAYRKREVRTGKLTAFEAEYKKALAAYRKREVGTGKLTTFEAEYKKALAAYRKREVGTGKLTTFEECLMKGGEAAFTAGWEAALKAMRE